MAAWDEADRGSWLLVEELLERGDGGFVDELRHISDAGKLGAFAARWYADQRPEARRLLQEYLARPLNAFRHEPLVKRLFKLAEKAGDDLIMARFLVAVDRSVRRVRRRRVQHDWSTRDTWTEESIVLPQGSTMPRSPDAFRFRNHETGERMAAPTVEKHERLRLFSPHTRYYLRRRAWRYFRQLGKQHPDRYLPAVVDALKQYTDEDVADGLALLDNWALMHILFHGCPALVANSHGWKLADNHTLAELSPAPIFEPLWQASASPLLELLKEAKCRPARQWAIQLLRRHHPDAMGRLPIEELLALVSSDDDEVAQLAADALRQSAALGSLGVERWLKLLETTNPQTLDLLCELIVQQLDATAVQLEQAVRLACNRALPVARLGLRWLRSKQPATEEDCRLLLRLGEVESEPLRPDAVAWARTVLSNSPHFQATWLLEWLDSRHADVRTEGWNWFANEPQACQDVAMWQRLLESPHDDVKLQLVGALEEHEARNARVATDLSRLDPELVRFLWASVLLNIHRGGRAKPRVVGQMVHRLEQRPEEASQLLPILGVALRSIRGPEWRAGLAGVVQLVEHRPELEPVVRGAFPELKLTVS